LVSLAASPPAVAINSAPKVFETLGLTPVHLPQRAAAVGETLQQALFEEFVYRPP
jgi:hypothetical protein